MPSKLVTDLNLEQTKAVTHRNGPLLVVAGAGTGKTTVITRRIAWLIEQKLATPAEILALTFTEKAAGEMEARVDQLVPYGYTDTTIATFHSFGDRMLREHALELGLPPEFRVLGTDEQELFVSQRIDTIDELTELRPTNNPHKYVSSILKVLSRAKDELVSPDAYQTAAQTLLTEAQADDDRQIACYHLDIARVYAAYEDWKTDAGVIDFGDQIFYLIQLLHRRPKLRKEFQTRYHYLLVDEFQDTNIAQYELVKLLMGPKQNLTVVGDDDQAIYKFRGAAVSNILGFLKDFPKAQTVVLTENYRSTQPILDAAYRLIRHNDPDRLESTLQINKRLTSPQTGAEPFFGWYAHEADELAGLVDGIKATQAEGVPLTRMAILVRSNTTIESIARALNQANLRYTVSSDRGFPDLPEIRGIVAFFQTLVHPDDSLAHMKLGLSPYYRFDPAWLLLFNDAARRTNQTFEEILSNPASVVWERLPDDGRIALEEFRNDLARYRALLGSKDAGELLYQFLKDRGILTPPNQHQNAKQQLSLFDQTSDDDQLRLIQNISAVFDAIKRYAAAGRDRFALQFIDQLPSLLATIVPPTVDTGPDVDAIHILTIHAAKGLEFDTVFLPSLIQDRFPARKRTEVFDLPKTLIRETLPTGDEHLEEERRLAYVAMTRAKRRLYLSGSAHVADGIRTKKVSQFVGEALELTEVPTPIERVNPILRIHTFAPVLPAAPTLQLPEYDGVLFLSPAMIEAYQQDPYNFYWRYVLKAPQPPSRHLNYGNAIHAAIEAYYRLRKEGKQASLAAVRDRFQVAWQGSGFDSKTDEERQFTHGLAVLEAFMQRAENEPLPTFIEEEFVVLLPGVRIRGRMDAVFKETGEIRDFKTSQVTDQKAANQKVRENIPIRIYAFAYQKRFGQLPQSLTLDFVDHNLRASLTPTAELLTSTEELIRATIEGIRAGNFDPNPNNPFRDYL